MIVTATATAVVVGLVAVGVSVLPWSDVSVERSVGAFRDLGTWVRAAFTGRDLTFVGLLDQDDRGVPAAASAPPPFLLPSGVWTPPGRTLRKAS